MHLLLLVAQYLGDPAVTGPSCSSSRPHALIIWSTVQIFNGPFQLSAFSPPCAQLSHWIQTSHASGVTPFDQLHPFCAQLLSRLPLPLGPTFCLLSAGYLYSSRREVDSVELPYLNRARSVATFFSFFVGFLCCAHCASSCNVCLMGAGAGFDHWGAGRCF